MPKSKPTISSSESEGSDDEPKQKKVKKTVEKKPTASASASKSSSNDGETKYEIGRMRYVGVSEFRGRKMVSIREYYQTDDGEMRPGKKGISLPVEQWEKLKSHIKDIDLELKK